MHVTRILACLGALSAAIAPAAAQAREGRCLLEVKGKTYLDQRCEIAITDDRGSFTIGVGEAHRASYFAYITIDEDGAQGYWNETPDASHAHASLGLLTRHGACWENEGARICAYQ